MADEKFQISLASARKNAGFTQSAVAEKMHISKRTIVNWENGRNTPSFANLQVLSQIYNIPIDYIFLPPKST
ncbi:MAG: helix-turn-helix domain-containing protein [Lachnospiraceae bacterium]